MQSNAGDVTEAIGRTVAVMLHACLASSATKASWIGAFCDDVMASDVNQQNRRFMDSHAFQNFSGM